MCIVQDEMNLDRYLWKQVKIKHAAILYRYDVLVN